MPTTLDPQEEREHLDDLEQNFNSPSAPEREPVSADELEDLYNMPPAPQPVYDKRGTDPSDAPGKKQSPSKKDLQDAEQNPGGQGSEDPGSPSTDHRDRVGVGYHPKGTVKKRSFIRNQLGKQNRLFLIGGGGALLLAGIGALLLIFIAPLKILHIVNNLQDHFYATSENAVGNETDVLFSDYLKKYVLPAARRCPGAVTKDCNPIKDGGLVSQLYKGWRNAKLEDKLATDYHIEFKYAKGNYFVKMPGMTGDGANIDSFASDTSGETLGDFMDKSNDPQWKKVSRKELRQSYKDALSSETKMKQMLYRYKIAGLLSKKYGLKRCIISCDKKDNFADWKDNKAKAAKMIIAERVISPRSETLGLVVQCVLAGDCDKTQVASNGEKTTAVESRLESKLAELEAEETGKYLDIVAHANGILKDGYQKYMLKQVVSKLFNTELKDQTADQALKVVPVLGWINTASETVTAIDKAPQEIKMASYLTNATAMISLWSTYRVYADETKSGNVDPAILGSFVDTLGPGQSNDIGGKAGAEQSPLYQNLIEGGSGGSSVASLFGSTALAASSASTSSGYTCADGKPVPAGSLVCQEEVLGGNNSVVSSIQSITDTSWFKSISGLADFWNHTAGKVLKAAVKVAGTLIGDVASWIPGVSKLEGLMASSFQPLIDAFMNYLVPSPFGNVRGSDPVANDNTVPSPTALVNKLIDPAYAASSSNTNSGYMSGGRVFDLIAGGADASGNEYAHNGLGGQALTSDQTAAIVNEQLNASYQQYQDQPLLSRLFDTGSNYSLVGRMALAMPATKAGMLQSIGSIFSNPFKKLGSIFGFIASPHAFAAASAAPDPFGITQYGYSSNDPTLAEANKDPEAYWTQNCSSDGKTLDWNKPTNAQWQDAGLKADTSSPDGMPENTSTDPCLLLQATVGSAGGLFDQSLLGQDQPGADNSAPTDTGSTAPTTTASTTVDMAHLYDDSTSVACAAGTKDLGTQTGYTNGTPVPIRICGIPGFVQLNNSLAQFGVPQAGNDIVVNSRVSGAVLALFNAAKSAGVTFQANSSFRTMAYQQSLCPCDGVNKAHPGYSNHQMGLAIDFDTLPSTPGPVPGNAVWDWLSKNAANFGYKNYPHEAWHWSPTGN